MNFFEHQDQARQSTTRLVMLFAIAIAAMVLSFYLVAIWALGLGFGIGWWQPGIFWPIAIATVGIIGFGSVTKMTELRGGGSVVAERLGGRRLTPQTQDPKEMQLLNVVAEMALASGTPIPTVYLLEHEQGINAFAAGYTPNDAVIGVTRGCLEQLTRDELQGVIGHEFSHIVNGDMGLNLKLMGTLQGLLLIYLLGRMVLGTGSDVAFWGWGRGKGDRALSTTLVIGLALAGIGGIGLLCGRLIKSAISRQREFLADASAVQFTRNPHGITDALRKIGGYGAGSQVRTPWAEEASHLFFGEALPGLSLFGDWFATHPPLQERIRRLGGVAVAAVAPSPGAIAPSLAPSRGASPAASPSPAGRSVMALAGNSPPTQTAGTAPSAVPESAAAFMATVGTLDAQHLASARAFLEGLSPELVAAVRQPEGAIALVYALLLDPKPEIKALQLKSLEGPYAIPFVDRVVALADQIKLLSPRQHLPLLDLAIPALRTLTSPQGQAFFQQVKVLVQADKHLSVSEYVLQLILQKRLRHHFQSIQPKATPKANATGPGIGPTPELVTNLDAVWPDCLLLLSLLARQGYSNEEDATYAFKAGLYALPGAKKRELPSGLPPVRLYDLGQSLQRLECLVPKLKQAVVEACAQTVLVDSRVSDREAELLRVIVISLDCPIPPFLESIRYN